MKRPGPFLPGELVSPRHATMDGLFLRGLCKAHRAELAQWSRRLELSPTAAGLMGLLSVLPRPQGRPLGVGLQLSLEALAAVLGRSRRQVAYAVDELKARGLVARFRSSRSVRAITKRRARPLEFFRDEKGRRRFKASTVAVLYPTPAGLDAIRELGRTRANVPGKGRVLVTAGLLASLWKTLGGWLALTLRKATGAGEDCTPYGENPRRRRTIGGKATAGEASAPRTLQRRPAPLELEERAETDGRASSGGGGASSTLAQEIEACWSRYKRVGWYEQNGTGYGFGAEFRQTGEAEHWSPVLTAAEWKPHEWAAGNDEHRAYLTRQFAPIRRELERRIARGLGPP